jgi:phosphoketolase
MFNQHAKWLKSTQHIPWRAPIASLNYLAEVTEPTDLTVASPQAQGYD